MTLVPIRPPESVESDPLAHDLGLGVVSAPNPIPVGLPCHYCEAEATTRDHIVAHSRGGRDAWWNLVPACAQCNLNKGDYEVCDCAWCVRAVRLFNVGYRRSSSRTYRDKKKKRPGVMTEADNLIYYAPENTPLTQSLGEWTILNELKEK